MDLKDCNQCAERKYGQGPVPGCGNIELVKICLLGRNPGRDEDAIGRPFVGRAGGRLNEGLHLAGLLRMWCRVTNVSRCMTPPNVAPTQQCLRICSATWLKDELVSLRQLELVVALGNQALHYFERLGTVGELHGTLLSIQAGKIPGKANVKLFVSYHPSAALRSTIVNRLFTNDMIKLGKYLRANNLVGAAATTGGK